MENTTLELIIGAVLPPVIDIVNRYVADERIRYVISIIFCLAIGAVLNLKDLNVADFLQSSAVVFAAAQTVYAKYYKDSGLQKTVRG